MRNSPAAAAVHRCRLCAQSISTDQFFYCVGLHVIARWRRSTGTLPDYGWSDHRHIVMTYGIRRWQALGWNHWKQGHPKNVGWV